MTRLKHGCSPGNGHAGTKEYSVWSTMRQRCMNPRNAKYSEYGARGIKVCERWNDFSKFLADMGAKPAGHSLDRIDNDGDYAPENCRWATAEVQANNQRTRRDAHWLEHEGERRTVAEWARIKGIKPVTLYARINRYRWPVARALGAAA